MDASHTRFASRLKFGPVRLGDDSHAEYKLKVLAELDACGHGESGQILRREGSYSSHIDGWRQQRRNGQTAGLAPKRRGRKPSTGRLARLEMEVLRRENHRLTENLRRAEIIISVKKNIGTSRADTARGKTMIQAVNELASDIGLKSACRELNVNRGSVYRHRAKLGKPAPPRSHVHIRARNCSERAGVLSALNSQRFVDRSPASVYAVLLEENQYLCSVRTMYRLLGEANAVRERRAQRRHPIYQAPQLLATRHNEVWSWDNHQTARRTEMGVLPPLRYA